MKLITIILVTNLAMLNRSTAQNSMHYEDWNSVNHWKIYEINEYQKIFGINVDSLKKTRWLWLGDDSMRYFLKNSVKMSNGRPAWMGGYLITCENAIGEVIKIEVSNYGGYFYEQRNGQYFEVDKALNSDWLSYFNSSYSRFNK